MLIGIFYIAWVLLTVAAQPFLATQRKIRRFDLFRMIPVWTFFAPDPGTSDYHLLSRTRCVDGTITPFREIPLGSRRKIGHLFFNPTQRLQKALSDHARAIAMHISTDLTETNQANIRLTVSYISLLHYCIGLGSEPGSCTVQFMILESFGHLELEDPQLVLNSEFHRL